MNAIALVKASMKGVLGSIAAIGTAARAGMNTPRKVEIGSGPVRGRDGWTTLDRCFGCDLFWDLRWGLPFRTNSLEAVYSSHVMEHFAYPDLMKLLAEIRRVLRPGGTYSAAVPNAALYIEAYLGKERPRFEYPPALYSKLPIDALNYIAYMDGHHRHLFDRDNLQHVLRVAKFREIRLRDFDPTRDQSGRDPDSIYVIAMK